MKPQPLPKICRRIPQVFPIWEGTPYLGTAHINCSVNFIRVLDTFFLNANRWRWSQLLDMILDERRVHLYPIVSRSYGWPDIPLDGPVREFHVRKERALEYEGRFDRDWKVLIRRKICYHIWTQRPELIQWLYANIDPTNTRSVKMQMKFNVLSAPGGIDAWKVEWRKRDFHQQLKRERKAARNGSNP